MAATPHLLDYIRQEIQERNYASISFPMSYRELSKAAEHFLDFLTLPDETKGSFYFLVDPHDEESDVGYRRKHKEMSGLDDNKEYFHYNRYAEQEFKTLLEDNDPKITDFLASAKQIYEESERVMKEILKIFDYEFPGLYHTFCPEKAHPRFYLRFLKYEPTCKENFLAKGHYDLGGCTLALAESAPGLRMGKNEETLKEVEHKERHAVFMPGLLFPAITSHEFVPAWHDVVQKSTDTHSEDVARWAIVFFADPVQKKKTTWKDRHTPVY